MALRRPLPPHTLLYERVCTSVYASIYAIPRHVTRAVTPAIKWRYDIHPPTPRFGTPTFPRTPVRPSDSNPISLSRSFYLSISRFTPSRVSHFKRVTAPERDGRLYARRNPHAVTLSPSFVTRASVGIQEGYGERRHGGCTDGGRSSATVSHPA